MKLKRSKLQLINSEKRYSDLDQSERGFNSYWRIFFVLLVILIIIIVFVTCYRYIYGQIAYICKRCLTRRSKECNTDDNFSIMKESESGSCIKRRFLWPNTCTTRSMEKEKLLAPRDNKILTSTKNVDLTKQLSLDMSSSSFPPAQAKYKNACNLVSSRNNTRESTNYQDYELSTQNVKNFHQNTYKCDEEFCSSETDLRYIVIPASSRKLNAMEDDERFSLRKWSAGNINSSKGWYNASSKSIELKFHTNSFRNNTKKCEISTSKSMPTDTKYFLDSASYSSDALLHLFPKNLKSSIQSIMSNTNNREVNQILNINLKTENNRIRANELEGTKSQIISNKYAACGKEMQTKMKSLVDISEKEVKNLRKSNESTISALGLNSGISETCDELGILFAQYMKLQARQCHRKYCPLKRHLKHEMQHSTRKCQIRFNYQQIYPYDQRPTCNSGNICTDTYDELKLMCTSPTKRKSIYERMFKRRKHFLNQPCVLSVQNFVTAE